MGRPYASELAELDATYDWALRAPIDKLVHSITRCGTLDALFIGSGGSLTSAHFASFLHSHFTGRSAQTLTPYEFASLGQVLDETAVVICSAGGRNPDVISAAQVAIKRMPAQLIAVTTRRGSPIEREFRRAEWPLCHSFSTPTKKDGFLATNSLLATLLLLTRAYEAYAAAPSCLPETLDELIHSGTTRSAFMDRLREEVGPLLARATLIVLHGTATKPAAMDVESRFTEAALAGIQPADYRNFAHGRHHWLAQHAASTAVLAFAEDGDDIARKTLALIPDMIPRWQASVRAGVPGALAAVCQSLLFASIAGEYRALDPGRPHVPTFGRKLYHLRAMPKLFAGVHPQSERMNLGIERKTRLPLQTLLVRGQLDRWRRHYTEFVDRLAEARLRAIVVDFDGTLCGLGRRLAGPSAVAMISLNAILDAGYTVAVATGRGKSVREVLLKSIDSSARRAQVIVGYHNGAEIGFLDDSECPRPTSLIAELIPVAEFLQNSSVILRNATVEAKNSQIAIELTPTGDAYAVLAEATKAVRTSTTCRNISVVASSHSVDVIAAGVSKLNVVDHLVKILELPDDGASSILCIGDRGRFPGNDADLLSHPLSLSVDQASPDPMTCWNLAEPGLRFDNACVEYLTRLTATGSGLRFDTTGVRS
jgi:hydroxymethylpyrimidine pyrophosphatase-like HAD family hydrolase/D-arabinose 5-phosphate isomerase GutQ